MFCVSILMKTCSATMIDPLFRLYYTSLFCISNKPFRVTTMKLYKTKDHKQLNKDTIFLTNTATSGNYKGKF